MKYAWLGCLLFGGLLFGGTQDSDINVNTRYKVDAVTIWGKGWKTDLVADQTDTTEQTRKLSTRLRRDLIGLIGKNLNPGMLDTLADRLRKELGAREVSHRLERSDSADHVRVDFEVKPPRFSFDTTVTKFAYNSQTGWSGGGDAGFTVHDQSFAFGMVSDGDTMAERFTGITGRYENHHLGTDKLLFRLEFESYHEQWNNHTATAVAGVADETGGLYRTRQNLQPMLAIALAKPLTLEVGASFERFQEEMPGAPIQASNAIVADLRYHQHLESDSPQDIDADYALRSASGLMASDFAYTSHAWNLRYKIVHGKHIVSDLVSGGLITGRAPLADRFVLGNSTMLRGWNKYDLDPIGGNRMIYNSVEYRYGPFQAFYDTGAIWDEGQPVSAKHSLGVGIRESIFSLAVAFPVRGGRVEPIFMMGLLY
jgi:surface antigen Omp85-like protein